MCPSRSNASCFSHRSRSSSQLFGACQGLNTGTLSNRSQMPDCSDAESSEIPRPHWLLQTGSPSEALNEVTTAIDPLLLSLLKVNVPHLFSDSPHFLNVSAVSQYANVLTSFALAGKEGDSKRSPTERSVPLAAECSHSKARLKCHWRRRSAPRGCPSHASLPKTWKGVLRQMFPVRQGSFGSPSSLYA